MPGKMTIADASAFFAREASHRSYPVVDDDSRLLGMASRADALRWQVNGTTPHATLAEAISDASQPLPDTPTAVVADMIIASGIGRIPIVNPVTRRVVGILSHQDLLRARSTLRRLEAHRPRFDF
jgi:CBS domain-containing protein